MIKDNLRSVACAVGILMFAGAAQAADIAIDGGFEAAGVSGFPVDPAPGDSLAPGWVGFTNGNSVGTTTDAFSGTYAGQLTASNPASNAVLKNANLPGAAPNTEVEVNFWAKGSAADGGVLFVELFGELAGGGVSSTEIIGQPILTDEWTEFTYSGIVGSPIGGGVTVQFAAVTGGAAGSFSEAFIDDVTVSAVPLPAAVWLLGSGILGLVGMSRRRKAA